MELVNNKTELKTSCGLYTIKEDPNFIEYLIKQITRWRKPGEYRTIFSRFLAQEESFKDEVIRLMVKNRDMFYEVWKNKQSDEYIHMVKNDVPSKVLKFILGLNYMYTVVDEIKELNLYKQSFKQLINRIEKELDGYMKHYIIKKFYTQAESEDYINNLEIMETFFEEMSRLHCADLQATMLNFIDEMKKIKTDLDYVYKKD